MEMNELKCTFHRLKAIWFKWKGLPPEGRIASFFTAIEMVGIVAPFPEVV
jgi:hypothetical protein